MAAVPGAVGAELEIFAGVPGSLQTNI